MMTIRTCAAALLLVVSAGSFAHAASYDAQELSSSIPYWYEASAGISDDGVAVWTARSSGAPPVATVSTWGGASSALPVTPPVAHLNGLADQEDWYVFRHTDKATNNSEASEPRVRVIAPAGEQVKMCVYVACVDQSSSQRGRPLNALGYYLSRAGSGSTTHGAPGQNKRARSAPCRSQV